MPSNLLLLLALLGGYLFNHFLHFLKFRSQRQDGHRLVFDAAVTGIFWLFPARWLVITTKPALEARWPSAASWWERMSGGEAFMGTTALALGLAFAGACLGNLLLGMICFRRVPKWWYAKHPRRLFRRAPIRWVLHWWKASREFSLDYAIGRGGDALQQLLHQVALGNSKLAVGLTLSNRRVYAAWVTRSPNLSPRDDYVRLDPIMSGCRHRDSLEVEYDYFYRGGTGETRMTVSIGQIHSAHLLTEEELTSILDRLKAELGSVDHPPVG